jgi:iron complex transport system substrate-binding protein
VETCVRRPALILAFLLALVAGCSSGTAPAAAPQGVTVEHAFGTTTVPPNPQRVLSAGYTEQDTLLALGVTPIAVTDWYGDQPYATWPWAREKLGAATPEVLTSNDGLQYERIAALKPDLILATNAGLDKEQYDRLTAIAPTVAQPVGGTAWFSKWDRQSLMIGKAVGKEAEATALVEGIKKRFAETAAAHPAFAGTPAIFLQGGYYEGKAIAYQDGLSTDFLTDLGFTVPKELDAFSTSDGSLQAYVPMENLSVLNSGKVLVWATDDAAGRAKVEEPPVYRTLTAVQGGHQVFTDAELAGAIYFTSPLSLPYLLDRLVPMLDQAVAGNPGTRPVG